MRCRGLGKSSRREFFPSADPQEEALMKSRTLATPGIFWLLAATLVLLAAGPAQAQGGQKPAPNRCISDCDCPRGELCSPRTGTCSAVPCPRIYSPVCGLDGQTYGNDCEAKAQHVVVSHSGECDQECGGFAGRPCQQKDQFCQQPAGQCHADGIGSCEARPQSCTREYRPVCGCDFQTYPNDCQRRAAGVSLLWKGPCTFGPADRNVKPVPPKACRNNADCQATDYCARPEGICNQDDGRCRPKPEFCTDQYEPVCGCNGVTYSNDCYAAASGINVRRHGACGRGADRD
jgi:hypothetical protein